MRLRLLRSLRRLSDLGTTPPARPRTHPLDPLASLEDHHVDPHRGHGNCSLARAAPLPHCQHARRVSSELRGKLDVEYTSDLCVSKFHEGKNMLWETPSSLLHPHNTLGTISGMRSCSPSSVSCIAPDICSHGRSARVNMDRKLRLRRENSNGARGAGSGLTLSSMF